MTWFARNRVAVAAAVSALASASVAACQGNATASLCCGALTAAGLGSRLLYDGSAAYEARESTYFSLNEQLEPWCMIQPVSTAEVSLTVKTLVATGDCQFAVRAGGHHHAQGINNIHAGVTIDLAKLNGVEYHADEKLTYVRPGALWGDVYGLLDPQHLTVAGGRDPTVGTAGLLVGGGNNFYAASKGMACDGVIRFEVVLGSGEVVTASRTTNADLWTALKGGNNNFGIVTRFDLDTFPTGLLWGGTVYYPTTAKAALIAAMTKFGDNIDANPASSGILFWSWQPSVKTTLIGTSLVNVDNDVYDAAHKDFYAIKNTTSSMRSTNITDITTELIFAGYTYVCVEYTLSFKNDARVMSKIVDLHDQVVADILTKTDDFISVTMFQPIPRSFGRRGAERGGNVLGLDAFQETRVMTIVWLQVKPELKTYAEQRVQAWYNAAKAYADSLNKGSDWIYLNYAYASQDPISGYGQDNVRKIAAAAKKYDPKGVFQKRVPGGFKITKSVGSLDNY